MDYSARRALGGPLYFIWGLTCLGLFWVIEQKISTTIKRIINNLDEEGKRRIMIVIPENAKNHLKF